MADHETMQAQAAAQRVRVAAIAAGALGAVPGAQAASSASYQINNAVMDAAGGTSSSASHTISACVGSEIAGAQSSASFRVESGCGPSALAVAFDFQLFAVVPPIPTVSGTTLALLVGVIAIASIKRLRALRR